MVRRPTLRRRTRAASPWRSRLRPEDLIGTGTVGLRTRRARAAFTALGIAIGIASMVAVLGISSSCRAGLLAELDRLGTNLLQVQPGQSFLGESNTLRPESTSMVRRIGPVESATAVSALQAEIRRNDREPTDIANGVQLAATDTGLLDTLGGSVASGRWHDGASAELPTVVLGSVAADRLGVTDAGRGVRVWIAGRWFSVIGVLDPLPLQPDLDRAAMVGLQAARDLLDAKALPSTIYIRTDPASVEAVRSVLARTVEPGAPEGVSVSRPSDALAARAEVDENLQRLLLGLGSVALLVGGVGIANVMVISVLERRTEIGVRRALGATRGHVRNQFVLESALLALFGGLIGVAAGFGVTAVYANRQGWLVDLPLQGLVLGVVGALAIGALSGLYPAVRAARLDPAQAVRPAA
ncbi:MAG: ABC transporter permease [Actinomycetota bacterium]